jgi:hypothetical protein
LEVPTGDRAAQSGILDVRDFTVVGEPALKPVMMLSQAMLLPTMPVADAPNMEPLELSRLRIAFKASPGNIRVSD